MKILLVVSSMTCIAAVAAQDGSRSAPESATSVAASTGAAGHDWRAFRGTDHRASHPGPVPREWSDKKNIAWQLDLPGPGTSSPIVVGDGVFVTCWSGYGLDRKNPGDPKQLRRHLLRIHRDTGAVVWQRVVEAAEKEDPFGGRMATHGYASSTPISDGARIYVFFGKAGVFAFDLLGERKWHADVGRGSSRWLTGSGSSLGMWRHLLFVNAADESLSLRALDKSTGRPVWQGGNEGFDQAYGMPIVANRAGPDPVLLFGILGEVWGLDPTTGRTKWSVQTKTNGALAPSIVVSADMLFSFGGQTGNKSHAIELGGDGDVTKTHVKWATRYGSYVTTPLVHGDHLYWVNEGGIAYCADAKSGELTYKERLDGTFYSSPVRVGEAIYYVSRESGTFVVAASPKFELLGRNRISSDETAFDGTPAVSDGRLFLRSRRRLYCVR